MQPYMPQSQGSMAYGDPQGAERDIERDVESLQFATGALMCGVAVFGGLMVTFAWFNKREHDDLHNVDARLGDALTAYQAFNEQRHESLRQQISGASMLQQGTLPQSVASSTMPASRLTPDLVAEVMAISQAAATQAVQQSTVPGLPITQPMWPSSPTSPSFPTGSTIPSTWPGASTVPPTWPGSAAPKLSTGASRYVDSLVERALRGGS